MKFGRYLPAYNSLSFIVHKGHPSMRNIALRPTSLLTGALVVAGLALAITEPAFAQDPFAKASGAARTIFSSLSQFALVIGGIGMVACLLLGFFGKLNWKWVWTGVGVSFALALVGPTLTWLSGLGGSLGNGI